MPHDLEIRRSLGQTAVLTDSSYNIKPDNTLALKPKLNMTSTLGETTRRDVGMYAFQTLNQNAVERGSSLKIRHMLMCLLQREHSKEKRSNDGEVLQTREIATSVPDGLRRLLTIWGELLVKNYVELFLKYNCACPNVKCKGNVFPIYMMKTDEGATVRITSLILNLATDGSEWSPLSFDRFTPRNRSHCAQTTGALPYLTQLQLFNYILVMLIKAVFRIRVLITVLDLK
jgi:hypothetical protein